MTPASPMQTGVHAPLHFDRGKVEQAVEDGAERLEDMADELYKATLAFEEAEEEWNRTTLIAEARIATKPDEYGKTSERTREGLVLETYRDNAIYLVFISAKAHMAALDKKYRALAAAVSARQSLLRRQS